MNKEQARAIARTECDRRGWHWQEPVNVHWGLFTFVVWTNALSRGGNVCMKIRRRNGEVVSAGVTPK